MGKLFDEVIEFDVCFEGNLIIQILFLLNRMKKRVLSGFLSLWFVYAFFMNRVYSVRNEFKSSLAPLKKKQYIILLSKKKSKLLIFN